MMLKGAKLDGFHNPGISQPAKRRNEGNLHFRPDPIDLTQQFNRYEAQWLSAHFDMLLPHFFVEKQLENIQLHRVRALPTNELVVVDINNDIIWQIIVSLRVEMVDRVTYNATPTVTIIERTFERRPEYPEYMVTHGGNILPNFADLNIN